MADKRTVTISVTINLGNYENLRLEVSDAAETVAEAGELRVFLADVLSGFAQNNATARDAIEKYRERILDSAPEKTPEHAEETARPVEIEEEMLPPLPLLPEEEPEPAEIEDEPVSPPLPPAEPEETPAEEMPQTPAPVPAPAKPAEEPAEFFCEKCGAPMTKLQHDVSKLFYRKMLCKDCIKSVNK